MTPDIIIRATPTKGIQIDDISEAKSDTSKSGGKEIMIHLSQKQWKKRLQSKKN